jgi:hypothetical protein
MEVEMQTSELDSGESWSTATQPELDIGEIFSRLPGPTDGFN